MENPADLARLLQTDAYDFGRAMPAIAPGSFEEANALAEIDNARDEETAQLGDTFEARQRRSRAAWKARGLGRS